MAEGCVTHCLQEALLSVKRHTSRLEDCVADCEESWIDKLIRGEIAGHPWNKLQKSQPEDYPCLSVFVLSYSSSEESDSASSQSSAESSCNPSRCTSQGPSCEPSRNPSRCPSLNPSRSQSRAPSRPVSPPPLSPYFPDTEDDCPDTEEFDLPVVKWAIDVELGCDQGLAQEVESAFKYHILAQADSLSCDLGDDHDLDCSPRSPRKKKRGRRGGRRHRRLTYLLSIPEDDHRRDLFSPVRPSSTAAIYMD